MNNRLMMTVAAAALLAGTGFANAQGTGTSREAPSAGSTAQPGAPATEHSGTGTAPTGHEGMKSTQSEPKAPNGVKTQRAEDMKPAQNPNGMRETPKGGKEMKAETPEGRNGGMKAETPEGRNGRMNAETKPDGKSQVTTGQAGAGAKLSTEQRTKITTVIRGAHVAPVTNVNFSISVGTRVPRDVAFHTLPAEVVTIYPEWRGYEYILVGEQIVVIDPQTFEIVAVIDA